MHNVSTSRHCPYQYVNHVGRKLLPLSKFLAWFSRTFKVLALWQQRTPLKLQVFASAPVTSALRFTRQYISASSSIIHLWPKVAIGPSVLWSLL